MGVRKYILFGAVISHLCKDTKVILHLKMSKAFGSGRMISTVIQFVQKLSSVCSQYVSYPSNHPKLFWPWFVLFPKHQNHSQFSYGDNKAIWNIKVERPHLKLIRALNYFIKLRSLIRIFFSHGLLKSQLLLSIFRSSVF